MKFCKQSECEYDGRGDICCKYCDLKEECEYACWRSDDEDDYIYEDDCIYEIEGD